MAPMRNQKPKTKNQIPVKTKNQRPKTKYQIPEKNKNQKPGQKSLVFVLITLLSLFFILLSASPAYGWGSLTHVAICRAAGGSEESAMGAHAPDMISLFSVTTRENKFDYAHNTYGNGNQSVFGDLMLEKSGSVFAAGWRIHQISDGVVHGPAGYSNTKTLFDGLPDKYGKSLNHGTLELIIDAIILQERFGGTAELWLPDRVRLIHETAVSFYNDRLPDGVRIPRSAIISCGAAAEMGSAWESWLITNVYLAELISEEPWFPAVGQYLADFRPLFAKSVALSESPARLAQPHQSISRTAPGSFLDVLLPAVPAFAAEEERTGYTDKDGYYRFVALVSTRARRLGQGQITKDSVKLALDQLEGEHGLSVEEQLWARTLKEMATGDKPSLTDLKKTVETYGSSLDAGREAASAEGAAGGRRSGFLPCLPGMILASIAVTVIVRFMKKP